MCSRASKSVAWSNSDRSSSAASSVCSSSSAGAAAKANAVGTGGACASDQHGRPLWLVFAWLSDVTGIGQQTLAQIEADKADRRDRSWK